MALLISRARPAFVLLGEKRGCLEIPLNRIHPSHAEVVLIGVGHLTYAIRIEDALQIRGKERLIQCNSQPGKVVEIRGAQLRVIDLRLVSGLDGYADTCPAMLLAAIGSLHIALAVDEVKHLESIQLPTADSDATNINEGAFRVGANGLRNSILDLSAAYRSQTIVDLRRAYSSTSVAQ